MPLERSVPGRRMERVEPKPGYRSAVLEYIPSTRIEEIVGAFGILRFAKLQSPDFLRPCAKKGSDSRVLRNTVFFELLHRRKSHAADSDSA